MAELSINGLDESLAVAVRAAVSEALAELRQPEPSPWMNLKTASSYLDSTEPALRGRVKRNEIPFHRRDGRLYFHRSELDAYVRGQA